MNKRRLGSYKVVGGWVLFSLGQWLGLITSSAHQGAKSAEGGASSAPYQDHKAYFRGTPFSQQSLMGPEGQHFALIMGESGPLQKEFVPSTRKKRDYMPRSAGGTKRGPLVAKKRNVPGATRGELLTTRQAWRSEVVS